MKLNREEMIKALECCTSGRPCRECAYKSKSTDTFGCRKKCLIDALFLINSQEQRIKELAEENERLTTYLDEHFPKCIYQYDGEVQEYCVLAPCGQFKTIAEFQKQIEADTVQKMQERLGKKIDATVDVFDFNISECNAIRQALRGVKNDIDQIAKEMLEG